jgi:hypothetical protein
MTPHGGSVHVFKRQGQTWPHQAKLAPAGTGLQDLFGQNVSLDDKHMVVGAPLESSVKAFGGAVYVYTRNGDDFGRPVQLRPMTTIETALFGWATAVDGETIVIGAPNYNYLGLSDLGPGNAYVFTGSGAQWTEQQALDGAASLVNGATFGWAVSISGTAIAIGAPRARSSNVGAAPGDAYVFERAAAGGAWTMKQALRAAVPRASDWYGWALKIAGNTLVVGSAGDASSATGFMGDPKLDNAVESGAVFVYGRSKDQWLQTAYIKTTHPETPDDFGGVLAMHGDTLVATGTGEASDATGVGGDQSSNALKRAGAAWVFR